VEGVAQALVRAINDPSGQTSWGASVCRDQIGLASCGMCKRARGQRETIHAATVFDSSAIPPIGIDKYLLRLSATFRCSDAMFVAALVVVDRLLEYDGGRLPLTMRNVHRIFLASLVVAVKFNEDLVYSNGYYAKAGGVHLREVNRLEWVVLAALDFDVRVAPEQYRLYEASLVKQNGTSHSEDKPTNMAAGGQPPHQVTPTRTGEVQAAAEPHASRASTPAPHQSAPQKAGASARGADAGANARDAAGDGGRDSSTEGESVAGQPPAPSAEGQAAATNSSACGGAARGRPSPGPESSERGRGHKGGRRVKAPRGQQVPARWQRRH